MQTSHVVLILLYGAIEGFSIQRYPMLNQSQPFECVERAIDRCQPNPLVLPHQIVECLGGDGLVLALQCLEYSGLSRCAVS